MTGSPTALLLPARLETRFDETADGWRLRVLVVPDVCWYDRHKPEAGPDERELLGTAVRDARGALLGSPGAPAAPEAAAAFDRLAGQVGAGRASWFARTFPAVPGPDGPVLPDGLVVERGPLKPRISTLPARIALYAQRSAVEGGEDEDDQELVRLGESETRGLDLAPGADGSWLSWDAFQTAGLTFIVNLKDFDLAPEDIACLYVTGLGDRPAGELFEHHLATGALGLAGTGTPTNTVAGAPAADLPADPAVWRALAEREPTGEDAAVSLALTDAPDRLGPLPGSDVPGTWPRDALLTLLSPSLFGHALHHVWGVTGDVDGQGAERLGEWIDAWLRPQGPLPVIRIGAQPYGVWPVTSLADGDLSASTDPSGVEPVLAQLLPQVRNAAAKGAAAPPGTVHQASSEQLWDLLARTPLSAGYDLRLVLPLELLRHWFSDEQIAIAENWWSRLSDDHIEPLLRHRPEQRMVTLGDSTPLRLGLILPASSGSSFPSPDGFTIEEAEALVADAPAKWLKTMLDSLAVVFAVDAPDAQALRMLLNPGNVWWWPSSLLFRLLVTAGCEVTAARRGPLPPAKPGSPSLGKRAFDAVLAEADGASGERAYRRFAERLRELSGWADDLANRDARTQRAELAALERSMAALLDTAGHRVDPWLTGLALRRLAELPSRAHRPLGLYAWVDRPFTGTPGPRPDVGFLLAPSDAQARAAVLLRDQALRRPDEKWDLDLDSAKVRAAARLAAEIRAGAHPGEAVGRAVERVLADRPVVDRVRKAYPLRAEHAGRRTCDGLKVLAAARAPGANVLAAPPVSLSAEQLAAVRALDDDLDAYADLLVAEAVFEVVNGRPEAAGRAMEAAAGLATPPDLDVLRTRRSGRTVHTTVLATLPVAAAPGDHPDPIALASPALVHWLAGSAGDPAGPEWTWTVRGGAAEISVTLGDLGLTPTHAITFDPADLDRLAFERAVPDPAQPFAPERVRRPPGPDATRRRTAVLAGRPPAAADLGTDGTAFDPGVTGRLATRLGALRNEVQALLGGLTARTPAALGQARRFGVAPAPDPDLDGPAERVKDQCDKAAKEVRARLDAVGPQSADQSSTADQLALSLSRLAVGHERLPVFTEVADPVLDTLAPDDGSLRRDWLEIIAAVRPALARVEAYEAVCELDGVPGLSAATSHPGDPWLTAEVAARPAPVPAADDPRLLVAYGPGPLPAAGPMAVAVLDTWAETVPVAWREPDPEAEPGPNDTAHPATAAFAFNAPAARPPQALLLAVAPPGRDTLGADLLPRIVAEARLTAHARMARTEDLGRLDVALPAALLPTAERGGFQFRPDATSDDWQ